MISLISTVLNVAKNLEGLLFDIKNQTLKPEEVIVVDGGSTDGTIEVLQGNVNLEVHQGVGRSEGRNIAIAKAKSEFIAVCDGGTRLEQTWLENITKPLTEDSSVDVVSGFFKPDVANFFQKCLAAATIPILDEIEEDKFLPSSRSIAFRKSAWAAVSGYPNWLPICEDLVFDIKLKNAGFKFKFEKDAVVSWRPHSSTTKFFKQYFLYAKGDGYAKLWLVRHIIRYIAYLTGILFTYLALTDSFLWLLPFFAAQIGYFSKFYYRYLGHFPEEPEYSVIPAFSAISLLIVVGDIAKMIGYPIGVYERMSGKIKFEKWR